MVMAAIEGMPSADDLPRSKVVAVVTKLQEVKELKPCWSDERGIFYPDLDDVQLNDDQLAFLKTMADAGLLETSISDTVLACPSCHKFSFAAHLRCPKCGSVAMRRERLIEHKLGGHIHSETAFRRTGRLVCPTCGKTLTSESEYRTIGSWYVCESCGEKHAQVIPELKCAEDGTILTPSNALVVHLYRYKLSDKALTMLTFNKNDVVELVASAVPQGMNVSRNIEVQGKSGVKHSFDLAIGREGRQYFVDVSFSKEPVGDVVVLASYAKVFDVGDLNYFLIVWPGLSSSAKDLSKFYSIQIIEASTPEELKSKVQELFSI